MLFRLFTRFFATPIVKNGTATTTCEYVAIIFHIDCKSSVFLSNYQIFQHFFYNIPYFFCVL